MIPTIYRLIRTKDYNLIPIVIGAQTDRVKNWFLRYIYAQHNARVIIDFENRMCSVIYAATGGMMSKCYYDADVMLNQIAERETSERDFWYAEGRKDVCEELGVTDPEEEEEEARVVTSAELISRLDDPAIAVVVNEKDGGRGA